VRAAASIDLTATRSSYSLPGRSRPRPQTRHDYHDRPPIRLALPQQGRGLTITVVLTLALGIGANAAIFTIVKGVLLAPLANEDEERLIYIRHSAPGMALENTYFSMPEIRDLQARCSRSPPSATSRRSTSR
jgi:hypothetical protein